MTVSVRIPASLRPLTDGRQHVTVNGVDVGEALEDLLSRHPSLRSHVFDGDGRLHNFVNVFVDGDDIRDSAGMRTSLGSEHTIAIIPAVAGG